jgi:hypothetical protein
MVEKLALVKDFFPIFSCQRHLIIASYTLFCLSQTLKILVTERHQITHLKVFILIFFFVPFRPTSPLFRLLFFGYSTIPSRVAGDAEVLKTPCST